MTNEEFERAIDFLLKSQARFDALMQQSAERQAKTDEQLGQLTERVDALAGRVDALAGHVDAFADTQANIMRVMEQNLVTEGRVHESLRATDAAQARFSASMAESLRASEESLRASDESWRTAVTELATRQTRTEEALARLAEQTAGTDRRLEALVKIVEEGRGSQ